MEEVCNKYFTPQNENENDNDSESDKKETATGSLFHGDAIPDAPDGFLQVPLMHKHSRRQQLATPNPRNDQKEARRET